MITSIRTRIGRMGLSQAAKASGFRFFQRLGLHVVPRHFYAPVPDTRTIPEDFWRTESELTGIEMKRENQLRLLEEFGARYKDEYERFPKDKPPSSDQFYLANGLFGCVDAEMLYCMIRHFKPRVVTEIGSGNSTLLSAQAVLKNQSDTGCPAELVAIEPHPNNTLKKGFPGLTRLVASPVQAIGLAEFERLAENDILFIDSSHVLKVASDVQYEYLEILPRLKPGVIVHFHDIFLPLPYPRDWVLDGLRFWNEQYLLQAFLTFNKAFEVLWAGSYMNLTCPDQLQAAFSHYERGRTMPGSFWVRKTS